MKLQLLSIVALCLLGASFAHRHKKGAGSTVMSPHRMMSQMMMMNPFERRTSEIDEFLGACLSPITQAVDVVIDIKAWRNGDSDDMFLSWPMMVRRSPMNHYDVAGFVDSLSKVIPKKNLYAVIVDGEPGNQTRYYVNAPVPAETSTTTTTTTQAPVTRFTQTDFKGGSMMQWWFQHSYSGPIERPLPSMRQLLMSAFNARSYKEPIDFPTAKNDTAPPTMFTVVITDSLQKNPISSLVTDPDRTVVLDIGGKVAANTRSYLNRNLLVVSDANWLDKFAETVGFMICQAAGGNSGQTSKATVGNVENVY